MAGMEDTPEQPLWARMTANMPGIATSIGFGMHRGSSTLIRGGFMDESGVRGVTRGFNSVTGRTARRANKYRTIQGGALTESRAGQFFGSKGVFGAKRATRLAQAEEKAGFLKSARVNNVTMRPRAFGRFHSLSTFGPESAYTPFQSASMVGKSKAVRGMASSVGIEAKEGESLLGRGTMSFIAAGRKIDKLERSAKKSFLRRGDGTISRRLERKLGTVSQNITSLSKMNNTMLAKNPSVMEAARGIGGKVGMSPIPIKERLAMARSIANSPTTSIVDDALGKAVGKGAFQGGEIGVRGNLMASNIGGSYSRYLAGYARGTQGFANVAGLGDEALKGAQSAMRHLSGALGKGGMIGKSGAQYVGEEGANLLAKKGLFKELGMKGVGKLALAEGGQGAKFLAARYASLAIPGLNVVAAVSMAYDLGKMGGELIKGGINLTKDAVKSIKGDIKKPLFGSAFKDNEAAATSRSRGVMAIQNSQLNARSALGNEGSLMAAHFG